MSPPGLLLPAAGGAGTQPGSSLGPEPAASQDREEEEVTVESYEVAQVESSWFLGSLKDTCYSAVRTVKDTVYDNVAQGTEKFAETVREVFKGELMVLFQNIGSMLAKAFLSPGKTKVLHVHLNLNVTMTLPTDSLLYYLGEQAMSVTLFLLCLLLMYVVLQFRLCSFLSILAFNATVFLLHHFSGPVTMFQYLYYFGSCFFVALSWMAAYPYVTSSVLACYLLWKISSPLRALILWSTHRGTVPPIEEVRRTVLALSQRLMEIEQRQIEMLELVRRLSVAEADEAA